MRCSKAQRLISEALDNELDAQAASELEEHLAQCEDCALAKVEMARMEAAIAAMPVPGTTEQDARRAAAQARAAASAERLEVAWHFRAAAIAAMLILTAGVIALSLELKSARRQIALLDGGTQRNGATVNSGTPAVVLFPKPAALESGVDQEVQAYHSVQSYLGGALRWMASDGDQVEIGMAGAGAATPVAAQELMVVSFQYIERSRDGTTTLLSAPQFVLVPGEEASVKLAARDPAVREVFRYRVSATRRDGQIRAEVSFSPQTLDAEHQSEVASRINAEAVVKVGAPVLLGASGDLHKRRELYMLAATRASTGAPAGAEGRPL